MKLKKNPKANLDTYSKLFIQLGLALALFVCYLTIEYQTTTTTFKDRAIFALNGDVEQDIPQTIRKEKKVKPIPKKIIEKIKIIDNKDKSVEDLIKPEVIDAPVLDPKDIIVIDEPTDEIDDIPYILVENAPVYPGCESLAKPQQKNVLPSI